MADPPHLRRLSAILAADVVGYSRLMEQDEAGTLAALNQHRETILEPRVAEFSGRIVKLTGDGALAEFTSVVDAISCAASIQSDTASAAGQITLRIGVNLGDVIHQGEDIFGDGVNIAARLESLSSPGGICISSVVNESVGGRSPIRFADGGEVQVKNIDRPLRVWHWHPGEASGGPEAPAAPKAAGGQTVSIAVLPFDNMSSDPDDVFFSDGICEDIITDLSKISGLTVIARNSSFAYRGRPTDIREVGRALGVTNVLEGSVRRSGQRVRINAQLIEAQSGKHLWADRFDRDLTDIFAAQDEVTLRIVEALEVRLKPSEKERITAEPTTSPEAREHFQRAYALLHSANLNSGKCERAADHLHQALELDPSYGLAHTGLSLVNTYYLYNDWSGRDRETCRERALYHAELGVSLSPDEAECHHMEAVVARSQQNAERAFAAIARALELNPNFADALFTRGEMHVFSGRPEQGIPDLERAIRLQPAFSQQYLHFLGIAHLVLGHFETAEVHFRERLVLSENSDVSRVMLAATLGHLGRPDDARRLWAEARRLNPRYRFEERIKRLILKPDLDLSIIRQGFEKADIPYRDAEA